MGLLGPTATATATAAPEVRLVEPPEGTAGGLVLRLDETMEPARPVLGPRPAAGDLMLRLDETMGPAAGFGPRPEGTPGGLDLALDDTMGPATGAGPHREGTAGGLDLALEDTMGPATGAGPHREGTAGGLDLALEDTMGPAAGTGVQPEGTPEHLALTLEQTIRLALGHSRDAVFARLTREEQLLALEAAEERYHPRASLDASWSARDGAAGTGDVSVGPSLRVLTGGSFRLSWSKPVAGERERSPSTALSFSQPLLKGFGPDIDTAPLRRARMTEEINVRAFTDRVAGLVRSVVGAYRGVLRAGRRVAIAREALARARHQLETNRVLVEAGRMAPQDLVQTQSEVADREYALLDAENGLDTANSSLVNTLDLDEGSRIEPSEEPPIAPRQPDLEKSLETAFVRRTDWLRGELGVERAQIGLRIAENNRLPNLSLSATVSRDGGDATDWSGRLTLSVPLWDRSPKRELARARNAVRRAELEREGRSLAERKLDIERLKLGQGLSSAYQLGRFEDDVVSAQNREVDALTGYRNALTSLDAALGTTLDRWGIDIERVGR